MNENLKHHEYANSLTVKARVHQSTSGIYYLFIPLTFISFVVLTKIILYYYEMGHALKRNNEYMTS